MYDNCTNLVSLSTMFIALGFDPNGSLQQPNDGKYFACVRTVFCAVCGMESAIISR
jgi:hypothetical protein